jgi:hypothetical protein
VIERNLERSRFQLRTCLRRSRCAGPVHCAAVPKHEELQKFSSIRAQVHNHFNQERHLVTRADYKQRRSVAPAEWRTVIA